MLDRLEFKVVSSGTIRQSVIIRGGNHEMMEEGSFFLKTTCGQCMNGIMSTLSLDKQGELNEINHTIVSDWRIKLGGGGGS